MKNPCKGFFEVGSPLSPLQRTLKGSIWNHLFLECGGMAGIFLKKIVCFPTGKNKVKLKIKVCPSFSEFFEALFPGSYKGLQITLNLTCISMLKNSLLCKERQKNKLSRGKIPATLPGYQMVRSLRLNGTCILLIKHGRNPEQVEHYYETKHV